MASPVGLLGKIVVSRLLPSFTSTTRQGLKGDVFSLLSLNDPQNGKQGPASRAGIEARFFLPGLLN